VLKGHRDFKDQTELKEFRVLWETKAYREIPDLT